MTGAATGEVVLALAGHVDHGKSALVAALTGAATDRRPVEQARGLTVDLGHVVLDGASPVAITDVPGHVDYLGNTLVGLAGATHALLVVAADDGWMPQTEDHLRAIQQLGVPVPLVAVTKSDLVDAARVEQVCREVRQRLGAAGTEAEIVVTSARRGTGVDAVAARVVALDAPSPPRSAAPRMWVDGAFDVPGRGRVVVGTLHAGSIAVGDALTVAPRGGVGRVRTLQRHGRRVDTVVAPARVAVDLADVVVERGERLLDGRIGRRCPRTRAVDAWVWSRHPHGVGERGAWLLHVGSITVEARVLPLDREPIVDGADAPVHIRLARPVPLIQGDRFVLRDVGRRLVAAGGIVLDPAPPGRARGGVARRARATALAVLRDARDPVGALVDADGGATPAHRLVTATADPDVACDARGEHVISAAGRHRLEEAAARLLDAAGAQGLSTDDLARELAHHTGIEVAAVRAALPQLGGVSRRDTRVVATNHRAALDDRRRKALARLHAALRAQPLAPDPLDEVAARAGVAPADLDQLLRDGEVLRTGAYGVLPAAAELAIDRLADLERRTGPFTVAQARDALGITRRHAVPWMELLDRMGLTTRTGDRRSISRAG